MHRREAIATIERIITNACNAVTNCYAGEAGATAERSFAYAGYAITYGYACEAAATRESTATYACNAITDGNACEAAATFERTATNACYAVTDCYAGEVYAVIERIFIYRTTIRDIESHNITIPKTNVWFYLFNIHYNIFVRHRFCNIYSFHSSVIYTIYSITGSLCRAHRHILYTIHLKQWA